jgi:hypothetical protein
MPCQGYPIPTPQLSQGLKTFNANVASERITQIFNDFIRPFATFALSFLKVRGECNMPGKRLRESGGSPALWSGLLDNLSKYG